MSTERDVRRVVTLWLEGGATALPDRVLDAVMDQLPTTPQRRAGWLARRFPTLKSNTLRIGIAGVAVVVLILLGVRFLPSSSVGGPAATPSPTASPTPAATLEPSATPDPSPGPSVGRLAPGTYTYTDIDGTGINATFTVPAGWSWNAWLVNTFQGDPPGGASVQFWSGDLQVYGDPCHWGGTEPNPATGPSTDDLVSALAAQSMRAATAPAEITVGSYPGQSVELTVPVEINFADCDSAQFRSWTGPTGERYHQAPGQRDTIWAVDVDGTRIVLDSFVYPGTSEDTAAQLQAILDSLTFSH